MANFEKALAVVLKHEGGYVNDPDDPGGETYKGIARKMNPKWGGWALIDRKDFSNPSLSELVESFYRDSYWEPIRGAQITSQLIAESVFDFAVNAGVRTTVALAQAVVDVPTDGDFGPATLAAIEGIDEDHFLSDFTIAKIARYISIVKKRPTSKKYFYGWVCRALGE